MLPAEQTALAQCVYHWMGTGGTSSCVPATSNGSKFRSLWGLESADDSLEVYVDDLRIDRTSEAFDTDWHNEGNVAWNEERAGRPHNGFGFVSSNFTRGIPGEIGGIIFRDREPAYYGDQADPWMLDDKP